MEYSTPPHTPIRSPHRYKATTRKKAKFFKAVDTRDSEKTVKDVYLEKNILYNTGKTWLRIRKLKSFPDTRRLGK